MRERKAKSWVMSQESLSPFYRVVGEQILFMSPDAVCIYRNATGATNGL